MAMQSEQLIQRIRESVIGQYQPLTTPFGLRPLVYADYTASGRALSFVEAQLQQKALPYYANTHSETSLSGAQSTALREQARQMVADALGCSAQDRIIFCGAGATAAINRLIDILNLRLPRELDRRYALSTAIPAAERPVVFIGPYEHHSNELPWRESIAEVVCIGLDERGQIDQQSLVAALARYADRPLRIGSFSAASNVTGVRSDVVAITRILKQAGALAFWDYAAAGPYVAIDMNHPNAAIDAVFLSPHKFIGGPGTPGVLAIKAALAVNQVPAVVGGGTVAFVSPDNHRYLNDIERREEAGTPAIIESIRAGLVFGLKEGIGSAEIERREQRYVHRALERLGASRNIEVLGPTDVERLAIFSLRFHHQGRDLHYGFVVALLNDLFGIQARGGCSCAGPYGHHLLNLSATRSEALDAQILAGYSVLRPGWVRLSFNYFISDEEFNYLIGALELIAEFGWRLLPAYQLNPASGLWGHRDTVRKLPVSLDPLSTDPAGLQGPTPTPAFSTLLQHAHELLLAGATERQIEAAAGDKTLSEDAEALRWFLLPQDIKALQHQAATPEAVTA
jgi:selenocysteine lyase/cysteine desulfurase